MTRRHPQCADPLFNSMRRHAKHVLRQLTIAERSNTGWIYGWVDRGSREEEKRRLLNELPSLT